MLPCECFSWDFMVIIVCVNAVCDIYTMMLWMNHILLGVSLILIDRRLAIPSLCMGQRVWFPWVEEEHFQSHSNT